jgi:hypothetical protein
LIASNDLKGLSSQKMCDCRHPQPISYLSGLEMHHSRPMAVHGLVAAPPRANSLSRWFLPANTLFLAEWEHRDRCFGGRSVAIQLQMARSASCPFPKEQSVRCFLQTPKARSASYLLEIPMVLSASCCQRIPKALSATPPPTPMVQHRRSVAPAVVVPYPVSHAALRIRAVQKLEDHLWAERGGVVGSSCRHLNRQFQERPPHPHYCYNCRQSLASAQPEITLESGRDVNECPSTNPLKARFRQQAAPHEPQPLQLDLSESTMAA